MGTGPDATEDLKRLADELGVRVRSENLHISGVAGGPFTHAARTSAWTLPTRVSANSEWILVEITHETSACLAGPLPAPWLGWNRRLPQTTDPAIFVPNWKHDTGPTLRWLTDHAAELTALIDVGERWVIAKNQSMFILFPASPDRLRGRIADLIELVLTLPAPEQATDVLALPPSLDGLRLLLQEWAISDDRDRAGAITDASSERLLALWSAVSPLLEEINAVLETPSGAAEQIGDLAQAALEARLEIDRRTRN